MQDLAKLTPGLSFVESGTSVPVFSLRGVGFFDTATGARPTVSVYIDEAPLPFSMMAAGAAFDLQRVEVLKGPQGTLFGQNATGGAINYIAAKPQDEWGGGFTGSFARFSTADFQGYVTGPITEGVNARLAVRSLVGGDWQKSSSSNDTLGQQSFHQGRFLLDIEPASNLRVSLNLNGFIDRGDTQAGQLIAIFPSRADKIGQLPQVTSYPLSPGGARSADWGPDQALRKSNNFYQAVLRADWDVANDITVTSLTAYSNMRVRQLVDLDGMAIENAAFDINGRLSSISTELRVAAKLGDLNLIVGGNYSHDKSRENTTLMFAEGSLARAFQPFAPVTPTLGNFSHQIFDAKAVFANLDWEIGRITLHGGVRYTKADLDFEACSIATDNAIAGAATSLLNALRAGRGFGSLPAPVQVGQCYSFDAATLTPGPLEGPFNQNNVSWRAGVDYRFPGGTLLYANVSKGYKAGSVPSVSAVVNDQLQPVQQESLMAYEAGFKASLADRRIDLSGAGFYYSYTDKQLKGRFTSTPNIFGPLEGLANVPKSRVYGAEMQLTARPVRGLTLTVAGTYLDTKVTSEFSNYTVLGTFGDFKGEAFPYTPKWQVVVDGEYRFPVSDRFDAVLGGTFNHRSSTKGGFGTVDVLKIDAYELLDLRAGFGPNDRQWQVQIFGRNVTNTYYWTNVAKYSDAVRRLTGQPATYGVQFTTRF